jgi:HNH endonuclease
MKIKTIKPSLPPRWRYAILRDFGLSVGSPPKTEVLAHHAARALNAECPFKRDDQVRLLHRYLDAKHPSWNTVGLGLSKKAQKKQRNQQKPPGPVFIQAKPSKSLDVTSDEFLQSYPWRQLRLKVLDRYGATCQCCGAQAQRDRVRIHVDHIKPRRYFPELALVESNLQVLCEVCNHGKGNWNQKDWRPVDDIPKAERPRLVKTKDPEPEDHPFWDQYWKKAE